MREQMPRHVPWVERLATYIPGYGGYLHRGNLRANDRVLRDAVADRLGRLREACEREVRASVDRGSLDRVGEFERLGARVARLADRIRAGGSGTDQFHGSGALAAGEVESLHAFDLDLFDRVDALIKHSEQPDFPAGAEPALAALEARVEEREKLLEGIR